MKKTMPPEMSSSGRTATALRRATITLSALAFSTPTLANDQVDVEITDRVATVFVSSVTRVGNDGGKSDPFRSVGFKAVETFKLPRKDGAEAVISTIFSTCGDVSSRKYRHISENRVAIKDGNVVSLNGGGAQVSDETLLDVPPLSAERLITDVACWIAYGKAENQPAPTFGTAPKDATRLLCQTRFSQPDSAMFSHDISFHEQTGRAFLNGKFAVGANVTNERITIPVFTPSAVHNLAISRASGQAVFMTNLGAAHGTCQRVLANKF